MPQVLKIGQLAQATGVSAKTIRYYEQVGVLPPANRTAAGYRQYAEQGLHRLLFIRRARTLGLSLQNLKSLTAALDDGPRATVRPRLPFGNPSGGTRRSPDLGGRSGARREAYLRALVGGTIPFIRR